MNAQLLKKLFQAIGEGTDLALDKVAAEIVHDERRRGHAPLASELERLLRERRANADRSVGGTVRELRPLSGARDLLLSATPPEKLSHHMVLDETTEARFMRIEQEFAARERLALRGLNPRRRVLLYGPPGCGKTLGASRLAWTTGLPLLRVRFDSLVSSLLGETASNLRKVFEHATQRASVLLLDECDYIATSRLDRRDIGEISRVVNTLLQLLEDFRGPGLVVATTNIDQALDPALFRRFDDAFLVPLPAEAEITRLLDATFAGISISPEIQVAAIARSLLGRSSAEVVAVGQNAAKRAVLAGRDEVEPIHLDAALREGLDRTRSP